MTSDTKIRKINTVDFSNTEIAFEGMSDSELKNAAWLFGMMNKKRMVSIGSQLGLLAVKLRLPINGLVERTIFRQFCGGKTLLECQPVVDKLIARNVLTILDYGAEGKSTEEAFNATMRETMRAVRFAHENDSVSVVSIKMTGLARFALLEKVQLGEKLTSTEQKEYDNVFKRLDSICYVAHQNKVAIFIDAEESWIQDTIDYMAIAMMERYNRRRAIIYNTFQLYRHDRLDFLKKSHYLAHKKRYILGAKLVRGAYMEKENNRALEKGYASPIQRDKPSCDKDFNSAIRFCIDNYEEIAFCNASHNETSAWYMLELIERRKLDKAHPHLNFCQLLGMSDHLSFNLAKAGFCVAKYVPYGPVRDIVPYLIRRAKENTAVLGDMSRELGFITQEMERRGLK